MNEKFNFELFYVSTDLSRRINTVLCSHKCFYFIQELTKKPVLILKVMVKQFCSRLQAFIEIHFTFSIFYQQEIIKMILNFRGITFLSLLGWLTQIEIMFCKTWLHSIEFPIYCIGDHTCVLRFLEYPGAVSVHRRHVLCFFLDPHLHWLSWTICWACPLNDTGQMRVFRRASTYPYNTYIKILFNASLSLQFRMPSCGCCVCVSCREASLRDSYLDLGVAVLNGIIGFLTVIWSLTWHPLLSLFGVSRHTVFIDHYYCNTSHYTLQTETYW